MVGERRWDGKKRGGGSTLEGRSGTGEGKGREGRVRDRFVTPSQLTLTCTGVAALIPTKVKGMRE